MNLRWVGSIALLAVIAVAALFLFPVAHGSYSATHGPGSALRSTQFRSTLMFVIAGAGFSPTGLVAPALVFCAVGIAAAAAVESPRLASISPLRR